MGTSLFSTTTHVQAPIVQVQIGNYSFGTYDTNKKGSLKYPNYVQGVTVTKINGKVNTYEVNITYPITYGSDPNYFEKVFSSVSESRGISFTYGDASNPNFLYKNEEAIILKTKTSPQFDSAVISYTVTAVSKCALGLSGTYQFPEYSSEKPSNVIRSILQNKEYGLQDLFTGMRNMTLVDSYGLIPSNDVPVMIQRKSNTSVLDYLQYLVDLMSPNIRTTTAKKTIYVLTFVDDTTGIFGGTYFKILPIDSNVTHPEAYNLDIGYPGSSYVYDFSVENDEGYSIFYNYQSKLHPQEYVTRLNADGEYNEVYAPYLSSKSANHQTEDNMKSWWAKVTEYPLKASLTVNGLLRPAILMTYVRLNIYFYGQKYIHSGVYIITKQVDKVDGSGYRTTLDLTRIAGEEI